MHLDEGQVQSLLHGELSRPEETSARDHLTGCTDCRGRVAAADREEDQVYALLRDLDHPPPAIDPARIAASAHAPHARVSGWGRWAAGFLVALGIAGAAYAIPGSPLPALVHTVVEWISQRPDSSPVAPVPPVAVDIPDLEAGGIAVAPGESLRILFSSTQAEGQVRVSLTDGDEVQVRAPIGAATFTTDVDRLVIDNQGSSATFEIQIPRAAPQVEIRVNGISVFLKSGPRVIAGKQSSQSSDARGPYLLPLTPPGS